jgi:acyl-CoA synthetase (AMP-forming)/AMP-acid ligase II
MTENLGCVTNLPPRMHTAQSGKLRSCGLPYEGCEVRIVDPGGQDLPAGTVGEIIMRSSWIMRCYWNQPEAVIGVPDERWGESVKAVVVLKPQAQLELAELQQYLRGRIGGFKIPRSLEIAATLPRNAAGKVLRRLLRDQFAPRSR